MLNPFNLLRAWAKSAVMAGVADAVEDLHADPGTPPAERLAALAPAAVAGELPMAEPVETNGVTRGGRGRGK